MYRSICKLLIKNNNVISSLSSSSLLSLPLSCSNNKLLLKSLSSLASSKMNLSSLSPSSSSSSSSPRKVNINLKPSKNVNNDEEEKDDDNGKIDLTPKSMSVVQHPYTLDKSKPIEVGDLSKEDRFAIIVVKDRQYKVTIDDTIVVNLIHNVDIGDTITIDQVLLIGSKRTTIIGQPVVKSAQVIAQVEEITKDKKVIAFKMRRRKNSKSTEGHRRQVVVLRINDIIVDKDIENLGLTTIK